MANILQRPTFSSPLFLTGVLNNPNIKENGSSSSNILNRYFQTLSQELTLQMARSAQIAARADSILNAMQGQSAMLLQALNSLTSRVDAASGYSQIYCDFFSQLYIDSVDTIADINYEFGQCTLPVASTTNLLTQPDLAGNQAVFSNTNISYALGNDPSVLDYVQDINGIYMLQGQQSWLLPAPPAATQVWTLINSPLQYLSLTPNVLELWPCPAYGYKLIEVSYQLAGDGFDGSWTTVDLTWLPNYNQSTGYVDNFGPTRLHLPNDPISQLRIGLLPVMEVPTNWGWHAINLYHREYATNGTIVVQDPYGRIVTQPIIDGLNPNQLSLLSAVINSSECNITLITNSSNTSPVITGIILAV